MQLKTRLPERAGAGPSPAETDRAGRQRARDPAARAATPQELEDAEDTAAQAATPQEREDAEDTAAVLAWRARDAAGETTFVPADEARRRLGMPR